MANLKTYNVKPDKKAIGERITQTRAHIGLSLSKMGERLGLPKATLNSYARGIAAPPENVIEGISILCGVSPHWLVYGDIKEFIKSCISTSGYEKLLQDYPELVEEIYKSYLLSGYEDEGNYYLSNKEWQELFDPIYEPIFLSYIENVINEISTEMLIEWPVFNKADFIRRVQMKVLNSTAPTIRYGEDKSILFIAEMEFNEIKNSLHLKDENNEEIVNFHIKKFRTKLMSLSKELDNFKESLSIEAYGPLYEGINEFLQYTEVYAAELNKQEIGRRIKAIRIDKNWTLEEFGLLVGNASKGTVSNWESGVNVPNKKRLELIALLGNTSIDWLLYGIVDKSRT